MRSFFLAMGGPTVSDSSQTFDAVVVGDGLAAFAAASALREQGKSVAQVYQGSGATSVSSGAWDFGPIAQSGGSFSSQLAGEAWKQTFKMLLWETKLFPSAEEWTSSFAAVAGELGQLLPVSCRFDSAFLLPCTSGGLRQVYAAQAIQAAADPILRAKQRVALVSARNWRFRADLLCRQWNHMAKRFGLTVEFRSVDLPSEGEGWDVPLARVSAELQNAKRIDSFRDGLARLGDSVDALLLPPVFPSHAAFEHVRKAVPFPVAEALASTEPTAGYRLHEAIRQTLERLGVKRFFAKRLDVQPAGGRIRDLTALSQGAGVTLKADLFVLASGRYFGGGLRAGFQRVEETVFGLPLYQDSERVSERRVVVEGRVDWSRLGVRVDEDLRPLAEDGKPAFQNLVACGSVLGGVDYAANQIGLGFFALTGRRCVASVT